MRSFATGSPEPHGNVRAYAVDGSFDDCHRLTKDAFAMPDLRAAVRLTSANSAADIQRGRRTVLHRRVYTWMHD